MPQSYGLRQVSYARWIAATALTALRPFAAVLLQSNTADKIHRSSPPARISAQGYKQPQTGKRASSCEPTVAMRLLDLLAEAVVATSLGRLIVVNILSMPRVAAGKALRAGCGSFRSAHATISMLEH